MLMPKKKTVKPSLKLVECEQELPKAEAELDELAMLIRSINDAGKKAKIKNSHEPEPPKVA